MTTGKDWRPTAFVDTAPGADDALPVAAGADAPLLALLRLLIGLDALAALAVALHPPPARAAAALALVLFLVGLVGGGWLHLRLLTRPVAPRDHRLAAAMFAGLVAGVAVLAADFWAGGWR